MVDIFKFAAQKRMRFPSNRGDLTVEQLFQLKLKSENGFDLDTTAKAINDELKSMTEESFVEDESDNPRKEHLTVALSIVKDVIKTKQDENKAEREKTERMLKRHKLLDAISRKEDDALTGASLDELKKQLDELG